MEIYVRAIFEYMKNERLILNVQKPVKRKTVGTYRAES